MKKLLMGLVVSLVALSSMAKSSTPWYGWMVFDAQVQAKYADTDKNDNGVIRPEMVKALVVVNGESGTAMLVYLDNKDYYLDCAEVSVNVVGEPKVRTAKNGSYTNPVSGSAVISVAINGGYWSTVLMGPGTWAARYARNSSEFTSQSATLTLTGAAILNAYYGAYGSDTARYNQFVSDKMNSGDDSPESVLAAYIAKRAGIPATSIGDITTDLSNNGCVFPK